MPTVPGDFMVGTDQELLELVFKDELTALYNRRFFARFMKQEADWGPGAPPLALAMIDMDNLKRINDRLGHMAGDATLKRLGTIFNEQVGEKNFAIRYAGDEFVVILPGVTREVALAKAEQLRQAVVSDEFDEANLPDGLHPSLSIGVALFPDDAPGGGDDLTEAADRALYVSKRTGKNKVTNARDLTDGAAEVVSDLDALSGFPSRTLVGRATAFKAIEDAVSLSMGGKNALLLVEGEAGAGKTRLLAELARYGKERGLGVLIERCSAVTREEPYKPITSLIDAWLRARPDRAAQAVSHLSFVQRACLNDLIPALEGVEARDPTKTPGPPGTRTPPRQQRPQRPGSSPVSVPTPVPGAPPGARRPAGPPRPPGPARPPGPPRPPGAPESGPQLRPRKDAPAPQPRPRLPAPPGAPGAPGSSGGPASGQLRRPTGPTGPSPARPPMQPRPASERLPAVSSGPPLPGGEPPRSGRHPAVQPPPGASSGERPGASSGERPGASSGERPGASSGERPGASSGERPAVPGSQKTPRPTDPGEVTVAIFTGLLELLAGMARTRPLVVVLDDMEHADEATLELVRRALPREDRVLFVGAARSGAEVALADEAGSTASPFTSFRGCLGEHSNAITIELAPLDREETAQLAAHLLAGFRPPAAFLDRLHANARGNPLYVEGALRHLVETRALVRVEDGWRAEREVPAQLPLTLDELIRNRLKILDPEMAELVTQAAVVGPNFDFDVLRASLGKREGEALDLVSGAVKQKLLRDAGPPGSAQFEFASGAVQEATYDALDPAQRPEAHRRVGEVLEAGGAVATPAALAFHFTRAGDVQKRERFAAQVRERRDLVFDRDAVESLGDGRRARIPEVTEAATPALIASLPELAKALANATKVVRQYPPTSSVVAEALELLGSVLTHALEIQSAFTISHRGNALTLNGRPLEKAYGEGPFQEAVSGLYRVNAIKSLTFLQPVDARELMAFLNEGASRSVQVPMERYYWSVFAADHDLRSIGIVQKTLTLQHQDGLDSPGRAPVVGRVADLDPGVVKELIKHLAAALKAGAHTGPHTGDVPPADAEAPPPVPELDRALRQLFQHAPALVVHEGDEDALVFNGTALDATSLHGGPEVLRLLRDTRLRGFVVVEAVSPQELARFVSLIARLDSKEATRDPAAAINADGSLPNILAGDALLQLARDLNSPRDGAQVAPDRLFEGGVAPVEAPARAHEDKGGPPQEEDEDMPPVTFRDSDLPAQFDWPSDAVAQRAYGLTKLPPAELLASPASAELVEVLEMVLLEGRLNLAFRVIDRMAVNFAGQDPADRRRAADLFMQLARRGSQELRASFFAVAVRRLGDAIELESDPEVFEKLAECARAGIVERVAEGDWDVAARLVWALGRRRDKRNDAQTRLEKTGRRVLAEALEDPRFLRVFETIETGSQQERRKAARILEGMGAVAVERLLRALRETTRSRVESFLIDMLAALVPESEVALQKEVTPSSSPADATARLLRASAVVCRDATLVLTTGLQNPDPVIQAEAVTVARSLGGKVAQNVLRWAIQHGTPQAQLAAVQHLGELARPDAVDELLDLLQRTSIVEVQRECCLAFGKIALAKTHHDKVVPALANCLRPGSLLRSEFHEDVRAAAAFALGQMKSVEAARKALEKALEDKVPRVRRTAQLMLEGK